MVVVDFYVIEIFWYVDVIFFLVIVLECDYYDIVFYNFVVWNFVKYLEVVVDIDEY